MRTTFRARLTTLTLAFGATLALATATSGASAEPPSDIAGASVGTQGYGCDDDPIHPYCWYTVTGAASDDAGGRWASAQTWAAGERDTYSAVFLPRGEILAVEGLRGNGLYAHVKVTVRSPGGSVVDRDTFWVEGYQELNLGTPDGSGDIAEGYRVAFQVCIGGISASCTPWVTGVA